MHISKQDVNGNPNLGLFVYANNKFCLVGKEVPTENLKEIEEAMKVPVHRVTIAGTSLIGVFVVGNDEKILVPEIISDKEIVELNSLGIKFEVLKTHLTALGNNILCSDKTAVVNNEFNEKEMKDIATFLNVKVEKYKDLTTIGSLAALNSKGGVCCNELNKNDLTKLFGVDFMNSSVNMGNPYIRSGLVCNDNGFLLGSQCTGIEINNADEALGFLRG